MPDTVLAAQLYTLREFLKTPEDIARNLPRVAKIGYRAVQLSALGPMDTRELKKILENEGLTVAATHVGFEKLRDELDAVVEEHQILGCKYVAIGGLPNSFRSGEGFHRFAKEASAARELADSIYADLYGTTLRDGVRVSKLASYTGRGSLEGWLRTVLAQEYVNRYRRGRRLISLDEEAEGGTQFSAANSDAAYSEEDEAIIAERLKSLGYIE